MSGTEHYLASRAIGIDSDWRGGRFLDFVAAAAKERRTRIVKRIAAICLISCFIVAMPEAIAGGAEAAPITTTDDPRRVRVPPRQDAVDSVLVLKGGTLIDGTGGKPLADSVIVIRGDRVVSAGTASDVKFPDAEYDLIDTTGMYVLPGLIDLHIHLAQEWKADDSLYLDSDAAAAIRGGEKLDALLDGGITTVRDVGTRNDVALKLKEAVERQIIDGPRVFWAGKGILSRGGHGDELRSGTSESSKGTIHSGGPYARIANGADEWQLAVREQVRQQVDLVKLFAPFSHSEVSAAIAEAHMQGLRVTVDAYGKYTTWAVDAGADSIEHTLATPDEAIRAMARQGTALVPTLMTYHELLTRGYPEAGLPAGGYFNDPHRSFPMSHDTNLNVVRKAHQLGVRIGVGTDMGFAGEDYYPQAYYVEMGFLRDAGMDNHEVLQSATRIGAAILGLEDKLGTVESGKLADVLVVRSNPLSELRNLQEVHLVIADGRVVRGGPSG